MKDSLKEKSKMEINIRKLKEAYVYMFPLVAADERFFYVPGADNYALSTYGRLFKRLEENKWKKIKLEYHVELKSEAYSICFNKGTEELMSIESLIQKVFFSDIQDIYRLYNPNRNKDKLRWDVRNIYALNKEEYIYLLQCKMSGKTPDFSKKKNMLSWIYNIPVRKMLNDYYNNMRRRACNTGYKKRHPEYAYTTMNFDWILHPTHCKEYILERFYPYPGKLVMDKDLMTFGLGDRYAPEWVVPLPIKYNNIFVRNTSKLGYCIKKKKQKNKIVYIVPGTLTGCTKDTTCDSYEEALTAARKQKANYVRKIAQEEREKGYMPEYIIMQMEKWADKCESNDWMVWEPDGKTLEKMGVHYDYGY